MARRYIILSVVSAGAKKERIFAFQLEQEDRMIINRAEKLTVYLNSEKIEIINAKRSYKSWGRITHPIIHNWIMQKQLNITEVRKPAKLIFRLSVKSNHYKMYLYPNQANLLINIPRRG